MMDLFKKTQTERETMAEVWKLANPKGLDVFDKKMFFMAIHLLSKGKAGNQLPDTIPVELVVSLDPDGYF